MNQRDIARMILDYLQLLETLGAPADECTAALALALTEICYYNGKRGVHSATDMVSSLVESHLSHGGHVSQSAAAEHRGIN